MLSPRHMRMSNPKIRYSAWFAVCGTHRAVCACFSRAPRSGFALVAAGSIAADSRATVGAGARARDAGDLARHLALLFLQRALLAFAPPLAILFGRFALAVALGKR